MDRIIIMDEKYLDELKSEIAEAVLDGLKTVNTGSDNNVSNSEWVDGVEARRILGYKKTKMQELRNSRAIIFSKYGRKIKYDRQSLLEFLEKNKKTKF